MKKYFSLLAVLGCLTMASAAFAQLPTNPWSPKPNDGYFEEVANKPAEEGVPTIPEYSGGQTNGEVLPVEPLGQIARPQRCQNLARFCSARQIKLCRRSHNFRRRLRTGTAGPRS